MGSDDSMEKDLCEELAGCKSQILELNERVAALLSGLSEEQITWKPAPDRWSMGECIDHLVVIGGLLLPLLKSAIERGRAEGLLGSGPFKYSWPGRMFIESLKPSSHIKVRTLKEYIPATRHRPEELLDRFLEVQRGYVKVVEDAGGLDLVRIKVASPANRLLRFSLGVWFAATVGHEQRHLEQAIRVQSESGFPS